MKYGSAISKLKRCDYTCNFYDTDFYHVIVGQKNSITIKMFYNISDGKLYEVTYDNGSVHKTSPNLTRALRALGDVQIPTGRQAASKSADNVIKKYVVEEVMIPGWQSVLTAHTERELHGMAEKIFRSELRDRKRYSYKAQRKKDLILKRISALWKHMVSDFIKNNGQALHSVNISASVGDDSRVLDRWGSVVSNNAKISNIPVFAASKEDAVYHTKSIVGPIGEVSCDDFNIIHPNKNEALKIFHNIYSNSAWRGEEKRILENENRIEEMHKSIQNLKSDIELSKKKIEMIKTISLILSEDSMGLEEK